MSAITYNSLNINKKIYIGLGEGERVTLTPIEWCQKNDKVGSVLRDTRAKDVALHSRMLC